MGVLPPGTPTLGSVARSTGNLIPAASGNRLPITRDLAWTSPPLFKWRHYTGEIILCGVRWYLRYALSYRDDEKVLREHGVAVAHTTVFRWVQRYAPELDKRCRPLLKETKDSYGLDETSIKIKKQCDDLYRDVDSAY